MEVFERVKALVQQGVRAHVVSKANGKRSGQLVIAWRAFFPTSTAEVALTQTRIQSHESAQRAPSPSRGVRLRAVFVLGLMSVLAGCAGAPPTYELRTQTDYGKVRAARNLAIAVTDPIASPALEGDHILIRTGPDSLAYLANAQWSDNLSSLVRFRLIETLQKANVAKLVGPAGIVADFVLVTTVRQFEIDVSKGMAQIEIAASLNSDRTGRPVAAKVFRISLPTPTTADGAAANALSTGFAALSVEIADWVSAKI